MGEQPRFYGDLAPWWPLISPVEDYEEEGAWLRELLLGLGAGSELLELGSGGGHVAHHLAGSFRCTLVDLSESMLEQSRRLNPGCQHVQGDMRSVRLGRTFDLVLAHDAIDYMATEDDLRAAIATAAAHCRPGGAVVLVPDHTREAWDADLAPEAEVGGGDGDDGRSVRFLDWSWDPDPTDTWVQTEYAFVLRWPDGRVEHHHESHRTGLFPAATWLGLLAQAGLAATAVPELTTEDRLPRTAFVGRAVP